MKYKKLLRIIALFTLIATLALPSAYAASWSTGSFSDGTNWTSVHTVYPNVTKKWTPYSFENRKGGTYYSSKNPSLTFYSYSGNGKEKRGTTMYVQILRYSGFRNGKEQWDVVYDYKVKSGQKIKLNIRDNNKKYFDQYIGKYYDDGASQARNDNRFKFRIRRYSIFKDVQWWGVKVNNGYLR